MNELTEQDIKNFREWSEGNQYLFELLCTCKRNNIKTFASCGGHEIEEILDEEKEADYFPYIGICIDDSLLNHIEDIVNELKYMRYIEIHTGYAVFANGPSFVISASRGNCCEVFYRTNKAIINRNKEKTVSNNDTKNIFKKVYANIKTSQILKSAKKISSYSLEECKQKIDGWDAKYDSMSKDLIKHSLNLSSIEWEEARAINPEYQRLHDKFLELQRAYSSDTTTNSNWNILSDSINSFKEQLQNEVDQNVEECKDTEKNSIAPTKEKMDVNEKDI